MPRETRERLILDVAGQVFARGDYYSSSMDEIAALADISKPMLYTYFGSKEGLYIAYIDRTGRELLDRLVSAAAPDDAPLAALRSRILEFLAFVEEHRDGAGRAVPGDGLDPACGRARRGVAEPECAKRRAPHDRGHRLR